MGNIISSTCDRCGKENVATTMSYLNMDTLCIDCSVLERSHPRFEEARAAELAEVKKGNLNYRGLLDGQKIEFPKK